MRSCQCRDPESKTSAHLRACTTHWINTPRKAIVRAQRTGSAHLGKQTDDVAIVFRKYENAKAHDNKVEYFFFQTV